MRVARNLSALLRHGGRNSRLFPAAASSSVSRRRSRSVRLRSGALHYIKRCTAQVSDQAVIAENEWCANLLGLARASYTVGGHSLPEVLIGLTKLDLIKLQQIVCRSLGRVAQLAEQLTLNQ